MKLLVAAVAVLVAPAAPPAVLCTKQWRLKKSRHCCPRRWLSIDD